MIKNKILEIKFFFLNVNNFYKYFLEIIFSTLIKHLLSFYITVLEKYFIKDINLMIK